MLKLYSSSTKGFTMSKRISGLAALTVIAVVLLTGCNVKTVEGSNNNRNDNAPVSDTSNENGTVQDDSNVGGIGFTYTGKPGIDLGGGFVLPFDGSAPGLGF